MKSFRPSDYLAALGGGAAGLTLSHINAGLTTISLVGGIAYLIWKWRREAKLPPTPPSPPAS